MNQYQVHPFHLETSNGSPILVTARSVVRLVNHEFNQLMHRLRDEKLTLITEAMLKERTTEHDLPHEATRDFLLARGVLRPLGNPEERLSLIRIASTDEYWRDLLRDNIIGVPVDVFASFPQGASATSPARGHQLWVLLLARYSEARIAEFYEQLDLTPAASGLVAYFRSRTLCISSVFSPAYGTPCHFCHMGWESRIAASHHYSAGATSISALMHAFEGMGSEELPSPSLSALDRPTACAFLVQHLHQLAGVGMPKLLQEEITVRHEFDLLTFTRTKHVVTHWPGCDCQSREVHRP